MKPKRKTELKKKILKSKFYPVNPYTKVIKCEPHNRARDVDWKYKNKVLERVYVGRKGETIQRLLKKGFKLK